MDYPDPNNPEPTPDNPNPEPARPPIPPETPPDMPPGVPPPSPDPIPQPGKTPPEIPPEAPPEFPTEPSYPGPTARLSLLCPVWLCAAARACPSASRSLATRPRKLVLSARLRPWPDYRLGLTFQ